MLRDQRIKMEIFHRVFSDHFDPRLELISIISIDCNKQIRYLTYPFSFSPSLSLCPPSLSYIFSSLSLSRISLSLTSLNFSVFLPRFLRLSFSQIRNVISAGLGGGEKSSIVRPPSQPRRTPKPDHGLEIRMGI